VKLTLIARCLSLVLAFLLLTLIAAGLAELSPASFFSLFKEEGFQKAVFFTLQSSLSATFLAFFCGVPPGFFLARNRGWLARVIDTLFDIPVVIPPLIMGVLLLSFFNLEAVKRYEKERDYYQLLIDNIEKCGNNCLS